MRSSDLHVERLSDALAGWSLDVVVSGSIGAVESVRFLRSLRRLGAVVQPWLTAGGARFITPTSLAWASGREVRTDFSGDASHIACLDACIVAPASASLIGKVAQGITDTPAAALVASYLGMGKPVLMLPNMHDSLAKAPGVEKNIGTLEQWGVGLIAPRREEGKAKFPEPDSVADDCAHRLNTAARRGAGVLITMGSTRGYIDDVRYISNYSSGRLGSLVAEELYRLGYETHVVAGASQIKPRMATSLTQALTNDAMEKAARKALSDGSAQAAVLAASVLDFAPKKKASGKLSSKEHAEMTVDMARTEKIIAGLSPRSGVKVGFKLESGLTASRAEEIAQDYLAKYGLSMIVLNDLADVDENRHKAVIYEPSLAHAAGEGDGLGSRQEIYGKENLALLIATHVHERLEDLAQGTPLGGGRA